MDNEQLAYIDVTAVRSADGAVYLPLINRSWNTCHEVVVTLPKGYRAAELRQADINAFNSPENPEVLIPKTRKVNSKKGGYTAKFLPCAEVLLKLEKK